MLYKDRTEASLLLVQKLLQYKNKEGAILAVPRGGVVLGYFAAKELNLPLDIILTKKIGHPLNKEFAIGTASLHGVILNDTSNIPEDYVNEETWRIRKQLKERYRLYTGMRTPVSFAHRTVIIIDDGASTGSTIISAVELVKRSNPLTVVVALPVGSPKAVTELRKISDELICLQSPDNFYAVGQFYENFSPVSDDDVIYLLKKARTERELVS